MKVFYLYCNSPATAINGEKGFVGKYTEKGHVRPVIKRRGKTFYNCHTTTELAFAKEFKSAKEAFAFKRKYGLCSIIFKRDTLEDFLGEFY